MNKTFPTLYKRTSAGAIEQWSIRVEPAPGADAVGSNEDGNWPHYIVTSHGQKEGKLQEGRDLVSKGKNLGKANATTPGQQAVLEAEAKWRKKIERNGYVEDPDRAMAGETDQEGGIAPMLAQPFEKVKKLKYPLLFQRKYNGIRCIAVIIVKDGVVISVTLWTRKRERILCMPHVVRALEAHFTSYGYGEVKVILDGELYVHGWTLQKIASYVRQKTEPKEGHEIVQYHVYDLPSSDAANVHRDKAREGLLANAQHPIVCVPTAIVYSAEEAWKLHDVHVQDGYEGGIGRRPEANYQEGRRSPDLVKFKRFDETEFKVVGYKLGRGKFAGIPVLICQAPGASDTFDCNLPGTLEERAATDPETLIGKQLTVKHFGYTEDKQPAFPVGVVIRDYE